MTAPPIPQVSLDQYERQCQGLHLIHSAVDYWAGRKPEEAAIINATHGSTLTWRELQRSSMALANELWRRGFRKGEYLAASLPLLNEHIVLEYACFRLGVIHVPLDLRLPAAEVIRCLSLVRAKGYCFLGKTAAADFAALGDAVRQKCDFVEHLVQFSPSAECIPGAGSFADWMSAAQDGPAAAHPGPTEHDGAQVIFTTGSTGSPKPALLSHRSITCQNLCLGTAFGFGPGQRVLCNLPASHVGGQAEILITSLFTGATAVTLEIFDAVKSLEAIEQHGVTLIGQIPAMFNLEWRTADYARRNLASLRSAVYGGQAVPRPFLERMLQMAPAIATGLGLTEASGFCTYTPLTPDAGEVAGGIGWAMPAYRLSIRDPMDASGVAGAELSAGQVGHICFLGPQNFLGYVNDAEATAAALSRDGWLYTGDLGFADDRGLHFSGRAKWVLKPAGYQVFPGDVENHFSALADRVANVGVVGHEHRMWSEGIVAFVERLPGAELTETELRKHARGLASYMRPLHYVILEPGTMPMNRTAKVDVTRLRQLARDEVARLRERGRWDG
ncbi:MAG TPA: class I adenylate-forming enzyme family protein [Bryobacteraceae bacterium]|nr:class I adenylate-forming enzyme family protein [Bryobacteraceae bacterium]